MRPNENTASQDFISNREGRGKYFGARLALATLLTGCAAPQVSAQEAKPSLEELREEMRQRCESAGIPPEKCPRLNDRGIPIPVEVIKDWGEEEENSFGSARSEKPSDVLPDVEFGPGPQCNPYDQGSVRILGIINDFCIFEEDGRYYLDKSRNRNLSEDVFELGMEAAGEKMKEMKYEIDRYRRLGEAVFCVYPSFRPEDEPEPEPQMCMSRSLLRSGDEAAK